MDCSSALHQMQHLNARWTRLDLTHDSNGHMKAGAHTSSHVSST